MTTPAPAPEVPHDFVLTLRCPDRPGIVHAVSGFLVKHGGNIVESQQFGDPLTGDFFMRVAFAVDGEVRVEDLRADFTAAVAEPYGMSVDLFAARAPFR